MFHCFSLFCYCWSRFQQNSSIFLLFFVFPRVASFSFNAVLSLNDLLRNYWVYFQCSTGLDIPISQVILHFFSLRLACRICLVEMQILSFQRKKQPYDYIVWSCWILTGFLKSNTTIFSKTNYRYLALKLS